MKRWYELVAVMAVLSLVTACSSAPEMDQDAPPAEMPDFDDEEEEQDESEETAAEEEHDDEQGVIGMVAVAEMFSGEGEPIGEVTFTQTVDGVEVDGFIETLDESLKGFHVHEFGECDPPDFETAGGHFNPGGHSHGGPDDPADQRHAGDFGNIEFDAEGVSEFSFVDDVVTLGAGKNDIIGQSLIVHYEEDDLATDPTGDAGPRAGCGIIEEVRGDLD